MLIKNAGEEDLDEIIRVWKWNIKTINTPADIAELFYEFKDYFFIAVPSEEYTKIMGFVGGSIRMNQGHISGIAVEREYRRRGIGSRLLETAEEKFKRDGFDKVTLEVRKSNIGAIRLYEKQGYKKAYIIKGYYADGEDAIVYEKIL
ncbi:MAG: ribosomal protein S18-alanine N-acetyltransferase [Candidatus Methanospirareceae archaeon]